MRYVALLRGINVGGNTIVSMDELKQTLEALGCTDVKTILNSGNVVFGSEEADTGKLKQTIAAAFAKAFGFPVTVLLRTEQEIRELIADDPFQAVPVTPTLRFNVTFLDTPSEKIIHSQHALQIIAQYPDAICTVVDLASGKGTVDMMAMLEKTYGKHITTRTWTTVQRIGKLLI
jgi:uncharacterized protein (DUF1697 family)